MRPIVYLDQMHWITLARAQHSPERVASSVELDAAHWLRAEVAAGRVCLPLSNGHLVETARAGTSYPRQRLARVMLDLHGGWFMHHPMTVRQAELRAALHRDTSMTPKPQQVFSQQAGTPEEGYEPQTFNLPPQLAGLAEHLSWAAAWGEVLLSESNSKVEQAAADEAIDQWVARHVELSRYMRDNPFDQRDMRMVSAGVTLVDVGLELSKVALACGLTAEDYKAAFNLQDPAAFFATQPFLGRVVEVLHQRLRNPEDRWKRNDLFDLYYIACAAGYADFIVTEKKMGHLLHGSRGHVTNGGLVLTNLRTLREELTA